MPVELVAAKRAYQGPHPDDGLPFALNALVDRASSLFQARVADPVFDLLNGPGAAEHNRVAEAKRAYSAESLQLRESGADAAALWRSLSPDQQEQFARDQADSLVPFGHPLALAREDERDPEAARDWAQRVAQIGKEAGPEFARDAQFYWEESIELRGGRPAEQLSPHDLARIDDAWNREGGGAELFQDALAAGLVPADHPFRGALEREDQRFHESFLASLRDPANRADHQARYALDVEDLASMDAAARAQHAATWSGLSEREYQNYQVADDEGLLPPGHPFHALRLPPDLTAGWEPPSPGYRDPEDIQYENSIAVAEAMGIAAATAAIGDNPTVGDLDNLVAENPAREQLALLDAFANGRPAPAMSFAGPYADQGEYEAAYNAAVVRHAEAARDYAEAQREGRQVEAHPDVIETYSRATAAGVASVYAYALGNLEEGYSPYDKWKRFSAAERAEISAEYAADPAGKDRFFENHVARFNEEGAARAAWFGADLAGRRSMVEAFQAIPTDERRFSPLEPLLRRIPEGARSAVDLEAHTPEPRVMLSKFESALGRALDRGVPLQRALVSTAQEVGDRHGDRLMVPTFRDEFKPATWEILGKHAVGKTHEPSLSRAVALFGLRAEGVGLEARAGFPGGHELRSGASILERADNVVALRPHLGGRGVSGAVNVGPRSVAQQHLSQMLADGIGRGSKPGPGQGHERS